MIIDRLNNNQKEVTQISNIQVVERFIYLETLLTNKDGNAEKIIRRLGMAKSVVAQLTKIWQSHDVQAETKKCLIYNCI